MEMKQLLEGLCVDVQAAVLAECHAHSLSAFSDVEDRLLQSPPPSQVFLTASHAALLKCCFRLLLQHFAEAEAVAPMLLAAYSTG